MSQDWLWVDAKRELEVIEQGDRRRASVRNMAASIDEGTVSRAIQLAQAHPNLSPGLLQEALTNPSLTDEMVAQLAGIDDGGGTSPDEEGFFARGFGKATDLAGGAGSFVYEQGLKPLLRGVFTATETLAEEIVQRPTTSMLATWQGEADSFGDAYRDYGSSVGVQAIGNVLDGDQSTGFDLGEGFFAGGQAREQQEQERTLAIEGQQANLGRAATSQLFGSFLDPGDAAYDKMAGITQFAADVLLDPTVIATGGGAAVAKGAARAGLVKSGTTAYNAVEGGVMGVRRAGRRYDGGQAKEILREADEAAAAVPEPALLRPGVAPERASTDYAQRVEQAGMLRDNARRTVLLDKASDFIRDPDLLDKLAEADGFDIYRSFKRSPENASVDASFIARLSDAEDQAQVLDVLLDGISEGHLAQKGFYGGPTGFRRKVRDAKFAGLSPRGPMSADDLSNASEQVDSFMRQANIGIDDFATEAGHSVHGRRYWFNRLSHIEKGDVGEFHQAIFEMIGDVAAAMPEGATVPRAVTEMRAKGLPSRKGIDEALRVHQNDLRAFRDYGVDRMGETIPGPGTARRTAKDPVLGEVDLPVPTPQIISELGDQALQLPDVADIRRAATKSDLLRKVYTSRGWDITDSAFRTVTKQVFKPAVLLRPAYIVRIGLEEQGRLSAAGYDSIFNHPFRYMRAVKGRQHANDLLGGSLEEQARAMDIITRDATRTLEDATRSRANVWGTLSKDGSEEFVTSWRRELGQLAASPEASHLAATRGDLGEFVSWARTDPEMRKGIEKMAKSSPALRHLPTDDNLVREWGESIVKRLEAKTNMNSELLDAIANRRMGGVVGGRRVDASLSDVTENANFNRLLRKHMDDAPVKVKHALDDGGKSGELKAAYDTAIEFLFDNITGKPSSYLARYPAMRQGMAKNLEELMPNLGSDALRREAIEAAGNLKLNDDEFRRISQAAQNASGSRGAIDNLDDLNEIVVTRAAEGAKALMFDLTRRSAAQDAFEVIAPFWDAFKEVGTSWGKLLADNPAFFLRAQTGYRSAEQGGVIYHNNDGDAMFAYPGGGTLTNFIMRRFDRDDGGMSTGQGMLAGGIAGALGGGMMAGKGGRGGLLGGIAGAVGGGLAADGVGADLAGAVGDSIQQATGEEPELGDARLRMEGRVEGTNMVIQGIGPGFGPVVQWGTGAFLPDTPSFDRLRSWINPFGSEAQDATDLLSVNTYAEGLTPAWAQKMLQAWTGGKPNERQWNSTVGNTMAVLAESGRYRPGDPRDQQRLLDDAERGASFMLFMRGLIQSTAVTGPQATWELRADADPQAVPSDWDWSTDPDGTWHSLAVLANEYHELATSFNKDYELADAKFIEAFGIEPFYVAQAKSRSLGEFPVDAESDTWLRRNEDFRDRHATVAGYFVPPNEDAELDFQVYDRQFRNGQRQSLTGEQQLQLANQSRARALRHNVMTALEEMGVSPGERDQKMAQVSAVLEERYPGWASPVLGVQAGLDQKERIRQLYLAAEDPAASESPVTEPLRSYLRVRDAALAEANRRGVKTLNNQTSSDLRATLDRYGTELSANDPAFTGVWSKLLSRELRD